MKKERVLQYIGSSDKKRDIYIYGLNSYARLFIRTHKIEIKGFISEDKQVKEYSSYKVYNINDLVNGKFIDRNTCIICFTDDFFSTKIEFYKAGFSPVNAIFDGMFFLGINGEPQKRGSKVLIVSSSNGIYRLNLASREVERIAEGCFAGLKKYRDGYLTINKRGIINYDENFNAIRSITLDDMDFHGIDYDKDNDEYIYVTETARNSIGIYNIKTHKKEELIKLSSAENDQHHINDLMVTDRNIFISVFSLKGYLSDRKENDKDGAIIRVSRDNYHIEEIIAKDLNCPHTLELYNDDLFYCDSLDGSVYCNNKLICSFGGFIRGLHYDGYYLYIGQTKKRRIYLSSMSCITAALDSGIYCYEPATRTTAFFHLPESAGPYGIVESL